jgi:hypothetical protein
MAVAPCGSPEELRQGRQGSTFFNNIVNAPTVRRTLKKLHQFALTVKKMLPLWKIQIDTPIDPSFNGVQK